MTEEKYTLARLKDEVIEDLSATYELVYVSQGDKLMDEQVESVVTGDLEALEESLDEFVGEQTWINSREVADDVASTVLDRWTRESESDDDDEVIEELRFAWEASDERDEVAEIVQEHDTSQPLRDLARGTGLVLLRIDADNGEDSDFRYDGDDAAEQLLTRLGFEQTPENLKNAWEIVANCCTEVGYLQYLVAVDVESLLDLPEKGKVTFTDPNVYLTNPFAGAGWADKLYGTVTVDRADLRTDKGAFGYGWQEVTGGVTLSYYESEMTVVAEDA
jgi:hypothetical protein